MPHVPTFIKIAVRYREFRRFTHGLWEAYSLLQFYSPVIHDGIKAGSLPVLAFPMLVPGNRKKLNAKTTYGVLHRTASTLFPPQTLISAVSSLEDFLSDLLVAVYREFPGKLRSKHAGDEPARESKLLSVILDSADRDEMIDRVLEEHARSIFYGSPTDFFIKPRSQLAIHQHITDHYSKSIEEYAEIVSRRNILIHNAHRVDRKYLREVKGSPLRLGQIAPVEHDYLRESLRVIEGLGGLAGALVIRNIYGQQPKGEIAKAAHAFRRRHAERHGTVPPAV